MMFGYNFGKSFIQEESPMKNQADLAEQEYLDYLQGIGAIREDGTIDRTKIAYHPAQTLEELEALLWGNDNSTSGS